MKILYVAMKYDYGRPEQGLSFEHHNFFESLVAEGHEVVYFDFKTLHDELGHDAMNRRLLDTARAENADLMFTCLFTDELDPDVVRAITRDTSTTTLNWFCDDHWRFEDFSARWAPCFDWVVTTASSALPKYERLGYRSVIKSQWGCNHHRYRALDLPLRYDVSFVGQSHGNRPEVIAALRDAGIEVNTWGQGWPEGRVLQEEMIRIFNQSRINLNLPNASTPAGRLGVRRRARTKVGHAIRSVPGGGRALRAVRPSPQIEMGANAPLPEQIKARNFEVPGCGGFLLTGLADDLDRYYVPGREIEVFGTMGELVQKALYYLEHDDERRAIAHAGYRRTTGEHTYRRRFAEIFATIQRAATGA